MGKESIEAVAESTYYTVDGNEFAADMFMLVPGREAER